LTPPAAVAITAGMRTLLVFCVLASPAVVFGRIGETLEQCEERYGKARRSDKFVSEGEAYHYVRWWIDGMGICAWFAPGGRCVEIKFTGVSKVERDKLLEKNKEGQEWHEAKLKGYEAAWVSDDEDTYAFSDKNTSSPDRFTFTIVRRTFWERQRKAAANKGPLFSKDRVEKF
jgi:hypothetical protein